MSDGGKEWDGMSKQVGPDTGAIEIGNVGNVLC